ncbi:hypothetical protein HBNCFIEN_02464 [Legionella sp. PC997]|nr:hypothetical protein HBNCFIEN_02464 [Legionella sp. PC997]
MISKNPIGSVLFVQTQLLPQFKVMELFDV